MKQQSNVQAATLMLQYPKKIGPVAKEYIGLILQFESTSSSIYHVYIGCKVDKLYTFS